MSHRRFPASLHADSAAYLGEEALLPELSRALSSTAREAHVTALDFFTQQLVPRLPDPPGGASLARAIKAWTRRADIMVGDSSPAARAAAAAALEAARQWRGGAVAPVSLSEEARPFDPAGKAPPSRGDDWAVEAEQARQPHLPPTPPSLRSQTGHGCTPPSHIPLWMCPLTGCQSPRRVDAAAAGGILPSCSLTCQ